MDIDNDTLEKEDMIDMIMDAPSRQEDVVPSKDYLTEDDYTRHETQTMENIVDKSWNLMCWNVAGSKHSVMDISQHMIDCQIRGENLGTLVLTKTKWADSYIKKALSNTHHVHRTRLLGKTTLPKSMQVTTHMTGGVVIALNKPFGHPKDCTTVAPTHLNGHLL